MKIVLHQFAQFMDSLDWIYIFSFILFAYAFNYYQIPQWIGRIVNITIRKRYQVLIFGFLYAVIIFFTRGYDASKILSLTISFCFATVFHKFLVQLVLDRFLPRKPKETPNDEVL